MAFTAPVDIANRAMQHLGQPLLAVITSNGNVNAIYDKLRRAELRRNTWRFATRRAILRAIGVDTLVWAPPAWAVGSYSVGAVVAFTPTSGPYAGSAYLWQTTAAKTSGNTTTPDLDPDWHRYFGPIAVDLWDSTVSSYHAGEIVIVPQVYAGGTTYAKNAIVSSSTTWYVSLQDANTGNAVTNAAFWTPWAKSGRSLSTWGETAGGTFVPLTYGSPSFYLSLVDGNADNPLVSGARWLSLTGAGAALDIVYPIGAGPSTSMNTRNVFRLPPGFLRQAPSDPKAGVGGGPLGGPSGPYATDWLFEGNYIVSRETIIMLRFIADVVDVPDMDDMFCEGLGARIGLDLAETITQAADKKAFIHQLYREVMGEARLVNGIETGTQDPPEDDWIVVRQ